MIIFFLIWVLYVLLEGYREAFYWHYKSFTTDNIKFNIHIIFTVQRALVLLLITVLYAVLFKITFIKFVLYLLGSMLVFSFLHNGIYYTVRNYINPNIYKKRWMEQSTTSTAWTTKFFTPKVRMFMFIIGLWMVISTFLA